jgi:hypothetical protein
MVQWITTDNTMTLRELIDKTAATHQQFAAVLDANLDQQLQQFAVRNHAASEYDACTQILTLMLTDSVGSLVETWLHKDD